MFEVSKCSKVLTRGFLSIALVAGLAPLPSAYADSADEAPSVSQGGIEQSSDAQGNGFPQTSQGEVAGGLPSSGDASDVPKPSGEDSSEGSANRLPENPSVQPGTQGANDVPAEDAMLTDGQAVISGVAHVQGYGNLAVSAEKVGQSITLGTTGQSKRLEGLSVELAGQLAGLGLSYGAHVQDIGWQDDRQAGQFAGTSGQSKRVEAVRFALADASQYSVWYRAHVQGYGWLGWARDGQNAGSQGLSKRMEAVQLVILPAGQAPEGYDQSAEAFKQKQITYSAHIQDIGTQSGYADSINEVVALGTTGQSKRLEGLSVELAGQLAGLGLSYGAHVQDIGWQDDRQAGQFAGTSGQSKRVEAVRFALADASQYSVWYRAHVQGYGWLGWARDGQNAGSQGLSKRMEAVQLVILPAGQAPEGYDQSAEAFKHSVLKYSSHIAQTGTVSGATDSATEHVVLGSTGKSRNLEGFTVSFSDLAALDGSIEYRAHVRDIGWQDWRGNGEFAGTSGQSKRVEAAEFKLSGNLANEYDIYYRAHVSNIGWMGWSKNGESAVGSVGCSIPVEAIELALVKKGDSGAPSTDGVALLESSLFPSIACESQSSGWGWGSSRAGEVAGTTGQSRPLVGLALSVDSSSPIPGEISYQCHFANDGWVSWCGNGTKSTSGGNPIQAFRIQLNGDLANYFDVYYRTHVSGYGWMDWAKNGAPSGTAGLRMNVEAYQIKIIAKGAPAPGATARSFSDENGFLGMPADRKAMLDRISGYSSGTQWLIAVDRSTHKVGVFSGYAGRWSLQYYWSCVTGAPATPTITGSYRTTGYKRDALSTDSRAIYCTQIWQGYFFHSILASESELGQSLSHGCIRMSYPSAKWIHDNIYAGTTVVIYN